MTGVEQHGTGIYRKHIYLMHPIEHNHHMCLRYSTEKAFAAAEPTLLHVLVLLHSNPVPSLLCWLCISLLLKKVNLSWNQLVSYRNAVRGADSRYWEERQLPSREESLDECFRWHCWDLPLLSVMAKCCRSCYESEISLVLHCHSTTAPHQHLNLKIKQRVMHKLQRNPLWRPSYFYR